MYEAKITLAPAFKANHRLASCPVKLAMTSSLEVGGAVHPEHAPLEAALASDRPRDAVGVGGRRWLRGDGQRREGRKQQQPGEQPRATQRVAEDPHRRVSALCAIA